MRVAVLIQNLNGHTVRSIIVVRSVILGARLYGFHQLILPGPVGILEYLTVSSFIPIFNNGCERISKSGDINRSIFLIARCVRTTGKSGFINRHGSAERGRFGRGHRDIQGLAHGVAVGIRDRERELVRHVFTECAAERCRYLRVRVGRVAVRTINVDGQRPVLADNSRRIVFIEGRADVLTFHGYGEALAFRVVRAEVEGDLPCRRRFRHTGFHCLDGILHFQHRHVVGDLDTDHSRAAVAVAVRHHHFHFVGDGIVFAATLLAVFLGGLVQRIGIGQVRAVKAGHVQVPLIRLDGIARQGAVLPDDDTADGDGRHAVRGGDAHAAVGRRGAPAAAAIQGGFVHLEHIVRHGRRKIFSLDGDVRIIRIRAGSGRRHGHTVVVLIIRARLHRICGQLHAAVEADVQTPQMVEAVQQVAAAVFVVAAAARGAAAGSGAGGGHQVFTKGREEILAADLHTFHLERRHLFLGIRGVEILQLDGSAILERQDEVVAAAGQRRGIRRKVKDEAPVRSAGDGLRGTSSRLGKTDIGHEGPPEKKWYLSKNR